MALVCVDIVFQKFFGLSTAFCRIFTFFQRAIYLPASISYALRRLLVRMDAAVPLKENA